MLHTDFSNKFHNDLFNVFDVKYVITELIRSLLEACLETLFYRNGF